jgi:hypothetical protein
VTGLGPLPLMPSAEWAVACKSGAVVHVVRLAGVGCIEWLDPCARRKNVGGSPATAIGYHRAVLRTAVPTRTAARR